MNLKSRYEHRIQDLSGLNSALKDLNKCIYDMHNTLPEILKIAQKYNGLIIGLNGVESGIRADFKANWITFTEYNKLMDRLDTIKHVVTLMENETS